MTWEAIQILNHLYLLTLVGSLLSILTLRIVTRSSSKKIDLISEYRTSAERAARNRLNARVVALTQEGNVTRTQKASRISYTVSIRDPSLRIRPTIEEAEQLMRTLSALHKRCRQMRATQLRRNLRTLKQVERDSVKLLAKLETANRWCTQ